MSVPIASTCGADRRLDTVETRRLALLALLVIMGCDLNHDYNSPDPRTFETHAHSVVLRCRTVNHSADTSGVRAIIASWASATTSRDASGRLNRTYVDLGNVTGPIQLAYPDSEVHVCPGQIAHFVGYQVQYRGDTARMGAMDNCGDWHMSLWFWGCCVALENGETIPAWPLKLDQVPDSLSPTGALELYLTVDLDGLVAWDSARGRFELQSDRIQVRRP